MAMSAVVVYCLQNGLAPFDDETLKNRGWNDHWNTHGYKLENGVSDILNK